MNPHDFAVALTGAAYKDAIVERTYALEKWGMQKEYLHKSIRADYGDYKNRDAWAKEQSEKHCPDDYAYSHSGYTNTNQLNMHFVRWHQVLPKEPTDGQV